MKPITRKEMLMAKAAGESVPDIEPITREEYFLNQIAEGGGVGGGGGGIVCELTLGEDDTVVADKTAGELWSALQSGSNILFHLDNGNYEQYFPMADSRLDSDGFYSYTIMVEQDTIALTSESADDYPMWGGGR